MKFWVHPAVLKTTCFGSVCVTGNLKLVGGPRPLCFLILRITGGQRHLWNSCASFSFGEMLQRHLLEVDNSLWKFALLESPRSVVYFWGLGAGGDGRIQVINLSARVLGKPGIETKSCHPAAGSLTLREVSGETPGPNFKKKITGRLVFVKNNALL